MSGSHLPPSGTRQWPRRTVVQRCEGIRDHADDRCQRIKLVSTIDFSKGFLLPTANHRNIVWVPPVPRGIVGVEFEGLLELSLSSGRVVGRSVIQL
jgi:hypothetical protein